MLLNVQVARESEGKHVTPAQSQSAEWARELTYRLFVSGVIDDDRATEALRALNAGLRRKRHQAPDVRDLTVH